VKRWRNSKPTQARGCWWLAQPLQIVAPSWQLLPKCGTSSGVRAELTAQATDSATDGIGKERLAKMLRGGVEVLMLNATRISASAACHFTGLTRRSVQPVAAAHVISWTRGGNGPSGRCDSGGAASLVVTSPPRRWRSAPPKPNLITATTPIAEGIRIAAAAIQVSAIRSHVPLARVCAWMQWEICVACLGSTVQL
jgi:hypothetical protein